MKRLIWIACILFTLVSCQETYLDQPVQNSIESNSQTTTRSFTIPVDSAMKNLKAYLAQTNDNKTRSEDTLDISEVYPVVCGEPTTRAYDFTTRQDTLLYVVNFKNDDGFVIMSADTRLPETVIAQIDKGNLPSSVMNRAVNDLSAQKRNIYPDYPSTGPGFFSDSKYPDEIFMNPNTVELYDAEADDHLTGNFNPTNTDSFIEEFVGLLCVEYSMKELAKIDIDNETLKFTQYQPYFPLDPGPGGNPALGNISVQYTDWTITSQVAPILTKFAYWHQEKPFNLKCDYVREYLLLGKKKQAYVGCFPLAIGKVMSHFKTPASFKYKDETVNWEAVNYPRLTSEGLLSIQTLLAGISSGCLSVKFSQGTFTFPLMATIFMRNHGFRNTLKHDYSFTRAKNALQAGRPPIIYAIPKSWKINYSHAWNIDGYKVYSRNRVTTYYYDGKVEKTETETQTKELVHCDFGWEGRCNGYYTSGIFKSSDENVEHDNPSENNNFRQSYVKYLHLLTY